MGVAYPDTAQIGLARLHPVKLCLLNLHGGEKFMRLDPRLKAK